MQNSRTHQPGSEPTSAEEWVWKLRETCGHYYGIPQPSQKSVYGRVLLESRYGLEIADLSGNIKRIERTRKGIRADDMEHVFMLIQQTGKTCIEHAGQCEVLRPGDAVLLDSTREALISYPSDSCEWHQSGHSRFLSVHMPRHEFLAGCDAPPDLGLCLEATHPMSQALRSQFSLFTSGPVDMPVTDELPACQNETQNKKPGSAIVRRANKQLLYDMIRLAFTQRSSTLDIARFDDASCRYDLIDAVIEQHLISDQLTLDKLAHELGTSTRLLQRELQTHDTSFSRMVRKKRLSLAASLLSQFESTEGAEQISKIAMDVGYRDLSNFNRSFKRQFNMTPREYRMHRKHRIEHSSASLSE